MVERPNPLPRQALTLLFAVGGACLPCLFGSAAPDLPPVASAAGAPAVFNYPLLNISLALAVGALLLVALLKRRHRPAILAVCLALSVVLHLFSLFLFSVVPIHPAQSNALPPTIARRIEISTPAVRESLVRQSVRAASPESAPLDRHDRLVTDRATRRALAPTAVLKAQANLQEPDVRLAGHGEFKSAVAPPKIEVDQSLATMPDRPIEVATVKIAIPQNEPGAPETKLAEPGTRAKRFDVASAPPLPVTPPAIKPRVPRPKRKDPAPSPVRNKIDFAAVELRQPEVKDVIQPAIVKAAVDPLAVRAGPVADVHKPDADKQIALDQPGADLNLAKRAAAMPQNIAPRIPATAQSAGKARMSTDSLAAVSPDRIERKKNAVTDLAPAAPSPVNLVEPVKMSAVQPLVASASPAVSGPAPAATPSGQSKLTPAKEKNVVSGVNAAVGKPRPRPRAGAPSKAPIRIGLGGEALVEPISKSPAVQEAITELPGVHPVLPSPVRASPKIEQVSDDQRAAGPAADNVRPSELAAVKIKGGVGSAQVEVARAAPPSSRASQQAGVMPGALIEGSGAALRKKESASDALEEQLAHAPTDQAAQLGPDLADMGAPVQSAQSVVPRGAVDEESAVQPVALAPVRTKSVGMSAGVARPAPGGRSALPVSQDSFVVPGKEAGVTMARAVSSAVSTGEQVATIASLKIAGGDAKVLAGRMSVAPAPGDAYRLADVAEGADDRKQTELNLDKAAGGDGLASSIKPTYFPAPGNAVVGSSATGQSSVPLGTLVAQSDFKPADLAPASETAAKESLVTVHTTASASDSGGLVVPAVMRPGLAAGGKAESGVEPVGGGVLQIKHAGGTEAFLFEPQGGGGLGDFAEPMNGAGARDPVRMDMKVRVGSPKVTAASDISTSSGRSDVRRSFLAVGKASTPEFVPEKAIYKMRKPDKRRQFIEELGGTAQTEEAVEQALIWLSRAQSDDGRWDIDAFKTVEECGGAGDLANEDVGLTGLVLLAYLGAGYTHLDGAYQETVRKGFDWLLSCAKEDGDVRGAGQMYGQAMATTALCELYSLTGDERLLEPTRRAVKFIVDSQVPESGWRFTSQNDSDTSVTGWQILALKSAQIAGFEVPSQTFKWMELWLDKVRQGADGGLYSYKPGHVATPVMTAEGAFCQLFMGETSTRAQAESVAFIMQNLPAWDPAGRSVHIYYWYYATLTMYLSGAHEFAAWNSALTTALLQGRRKSGPAAGSWDPVCRLGTHGGRVYSTAVGALCLEVYYRFLPLYKQKRS